jgi:cytochrome c peroxidase
VGDLRSRNPGFDNTFNTADDIFGSPGVPQNNLNGSYSPNTFFGFNEQVTGRKSPSYLNAGYPRSGLFWDGRAPDIFRDQLSNNILLTGWASLESQSAAPPISSAEMAHTGRNWSQVAERIAASKPLALARNIPPALKTWIGNRTYAELFAEVFGTPDVTPARISFAIATHERTLFSDRTPLDKAVMQLAPLTPQEMRGQDVFVNQLCIGCHGGVLLSDQNFHNIGVRPQVEDPGRFSVTGLEQDRGRFRTPNLRNVELRGPLMHNGRFETIGDVVEFYNRGGDFDAPNIDHDLIRPLNLTPDEKADLVAFLKRPLTDPRVVNELPPFDRPQLYTESNRVPQVSGVGRSGSGGFVPRVIAIEPPIAGNPSFTIAVSNCLGNAEAVLVIDSADPGIGATIPVTGTFARVSINLSGVGSGNGFGSVSFAIPENSELVGQTFFGRWYVTDAAAANGFSVSQVFQFTIFRSSFALQSLFDYDGDGKSDISVFRPSTGAWYLLQSQAGFSGMLFGTLTDKITPADFDGDGKTDIAVYRPSTGYWYVVNSSNGTISINLFGTAEDLPAPGDYDGDGKADLAVFRPSDGTWYRTNRSTGTLVSVQFGASGDKPTIGDFDGDGKTDIAVYRPSSGSWYRLNSSTGAFVGQAFGISTDVVTPADFDGDGKVDIAVYRPSNGTWYIVDSSNSAFRYVVFGLATDIPATGDFDGDGKADVSVFRPSEGTWYRLNSSNGAFSAYQFGAIGDRPTQSAFGN